MTTMLIAIALTLTVTRQPYFEHKNVYYKSWVPPVHREIVSDSHNQPPLHHKSNANLNIKRGGICRGWSDDMKTGAQVSARVITSSARLHIRCPFVEVLATNLTTASKVYLLPGRYH